MNDTLFGLSESYEQMLEQGISLSGENQMFFVDGRIRDLLRRLPRDFRPSRILDFGCGIGKATARLADVFPTASVVGMDIADPALARAERQYGSSRITFRNAATLSPGDSFDLCYCNGVFHHIEPELRPRIVRNLHDALADRAYCAIFENNPWNPGTRMVMRRIPFDRDAKMLSCLSLRRLLRENGFRTTRPPRFLFYYPRSLAFLRFTEVGLTRVPLGAQYYVLGYK